MLNLYSPGSDFSAGNDYLSPVDGLSYLNFFRGGAKVLTRNLVGNSPIQGGIPTYGDGYAIFDGPTAYLDTPMTHASAMTFLCVARTLDADPNTTQSAYMSTWDSSGTAAGASIGPRLTGVRGFAVADNGGVAVNMIEDLAVDETAFRFLAMTVNNAVSGTTVLRIIDKTANLSSVETQPYNLRSTTRKVRIGSNYPLGYTGNTQIAFAACAPSVLSDTDIDKLYESAKIVCALDSITI